MLMKYVIWKKRVDRFHAKVEAVGKARGTISDNAYYLETKLTYYKQYLENDWNNNNDSNNNNNNKIIQLKLKGKGKGELPVQKPHQIIQMKINKIILY